MILLLLFLLIASIILNQPETRQESWGHQHLPPRALMTVFLTLGDGDFSYSLDLARYLLSLDRSRNQSSYEEDDRFGHHLIATGVDSLADMQGKYKDCDYILRTLKGLGQSGTLHVDVLHEVNAVKAGGSLPDTITSAHVVLFNHPHLGCEDAARHGRFLSHFMKECSEKWLEKGGTLQLTLAQGQWERWHGQEVSTRQRLRLVHRIQFLPPPVSEPRYQHRRHHTGKSFHARTFGSETFVLMRSSEVAEGRTRPHLFEWQQRQLSAGSIMDQTSNDDFVCPHCKRNFREERSLKSHIKAVHDETSSKKEKLTCSRCEIQGIKDKIFSSEEALRDHVRAKHVGLHTDLRPEWAIPSIKSEDHIQEEHGRCSTCGFMFKTIDEKSRHEEEFLPTSVPQQPTFVCTFCDRTFCSQRALFQHENNCQAAQSIP
jgi:hypothetical protein